MKKGLKQFLAKENRKTKVVGTSYNAFKTDNKQGQECV